jgi:hypothetical protein
MRSAVSNTFLQRRTNKTGAKHRIFYGQDVRYAARAMDGGSGDFP